MGVTRLSKVDVARQQLERAISLHTDDRDYISAITLAGAAEEILGKLAAAQNKVNSLEGLVRTACYIVSKVEGRETTAAERKVFVTRANRARNGLKHWDSGSPTEIELDLEDEASDIIQRAVVNYEILGFDTTETMGNFMIGLLHPSQVKRIQGG